MGEELWFMLIFWFISLLVGMKFKQQFFLGLSALIALFIGFLCMTQIYVWLGITFIFASIYTLYYTLFKLISGEKKKK